MSPRHSTPLNPRFGFLYRIGQCPRCMRQSFLVAACSLAAAALTLLFGDSLSALAISGILAIAAASVVLWLIHIVVFAIRGLRRPEVLQSKETGMPGERPADAGQPGLGSNALASRRSAVLLFLKLAAGAVLATALPSRAMAWGECPGKLNCGNSSCGGGGVWCCPKGYPILNLCNCSCYQNVQAVMQAGCSSTGSCFNENF